MAWLPSCRVLVALLLLCSPVFAADVGPPPAAAQAVVLRAMAAVEQAEANLIVGHIRDGLVLITGIMLGAAIVGACYFRRFVASLLIRISKQMATMQEQMDAAVLALQSSNSAMATDLLAIGNKVDAQSAQIVALEAQIAAGGTSTVTQASLDALTAAAAASQANTDKAAALATAAPPAT